MDDYLYNKFFRTWCNICENNKKALINTWGNARRYTNLILNELNIEQEILIILGNIIDGKTIT